MQTIGEKLEEARKRRGISIREASEVTKIRGDYLASFEANNFELNVPAIYARGFLRAYAQFLKLNPEKVMTDYSAHQLGESKLARRESREFLGRMDLEPREDEAAEDFRPPSAPHHPVMSDADQAEPRYRFFDSVALVKGGAAVAAALVLVLVIVVVVNAVLRTDPTAAEAGIAQAGVGTPATSLQEITLYAVGGSINAVTATEVGTGREIFRGPLPQGTSQKISFNGSVRMTYTDAQFLQYEHNGERRASQGSGPRQMTFPLPAATTRS